MKSRIIFILILALCLFSSQAFSMGGKPPKASQPKVGKIAPDFVLKDLSGKTVKLSDHKGKVVVLNFFATWCPPCRDEAPSIEKLYASLKGKGFAMIAVGLDRDGILSVKPFADEKGLRFEILLDPDSGVADAWGIQAIPTTFILDKNGVIVDKIIGGKDWSDPSVENKLRGMIEK